eukprot:TRINITY_DN5706_c0_g1_i7.p1 TRINITY_DN5706_c0_g1~~TRINITY_DN5706_c0_g1_i7.p1  ORF type:complete len:114 (-),score=7.94 TRINITY_DN5706_c0_g1_i7:263-604(-)
MYFVKQLSSGIRKFMVLVSQYVNSYLFSSVLEGTSFSSCWVSFDGFFLMISNIQHYLQMVKIGIFFVRTREDLKVCHLFVSIYIAKLAELRNQELLITHPKLKKMLVCNLYPG